MNLKKALQGYLLTENARGDVENKTVAPADLRLSQSYGVIQSPELHHTRSSIEICVVGCVDPANTYVLERPRGQVNNVYAHLSDIWSASVEISFLLKS